MCLQRKTHYWNQITFLYIIETFANEKVKRIFSINKNYRVIIDFFIEFIELVTKQVEQEIITAYVSLGSNLGDRAGNLLLAVRGLMEAGLHVCRLSAIYETEPIGVDEHNSYLNMVAEIHITNISPSQMLARMVRIEYLLGRRNKFLQAPRTVDLDLLFYDDLILNTDFITIPHRHLHKRRFVLVPLAELNPHFHHPVENKTIQELLVEVEDFSAVIRWNPNSKIKKSSNSQSFSKSSTS